MDRKRMRPEALEKLIAAAAKYKYVIAAVLLGVLLMLLPSGMRNAGASAAETASSGRAAVQGEMEAALSGIDGVGRLRLMLTDAPDTGSGTRWTGALIVCEGGGAAAVRLQLTQAVSALTGLPSDRIVIVKGKP